MDPIEAGDADLEEGGGLNFKMASFNVSIRDRRHANSISIRSTSRGLEPNSRTDEAFCNSEDVVHEA